MALKVCFLGAVRRRTFICCRNIQISASSAARDRNRSVTIQTMSLIRSLIPRQHRLILNQLLVRLSLRQGQPLAFGNIRAGRGVTLTRDPHVQPSGFCHHREPIQMISLLSLVNNIGSATEPALRYLEHHHWFFGIILIGYIFRLHDKSLHARFSALDKRVNEIRKRLACDI
jgi:hypothetical protein